MSYFVLIDFVATPNIVVKQPKKIKLLTDSYYLKCIEVHVMYSSIELS